MHAPEVECISKGKAHKRYEFGCKVGMVTTSKGNWILGIDAIHGNPYDGHTLKASIGASDEDSRLAAEGSVLRQRVPGKRNNRGNNGKADKPDEKEREPKGMEMV